MVGAAGGAAHAVKLGSRYGRWHRETAENRRGRVDDRRAHFNAMDMLQPGIEASTVRDRLDWCWQSQGWPLAQAPDRKADAAAFLERKAPRRVALLLQRLRHGMATDGVCRPRSRNAGRVRKKPFATILACLVRHLPAAFLWRHSPYSSSPLQYKGLNSRAGRVVQ
jgi:hypothetical protein